MNIPICDVQIDPDYEKNVTPTFVQSVPYIKYVRRVGDDTDITTDYQCDKDDEVRGTTTMFIVVCDCGTDALLFLLLVELFVQLVTRQVSRREV